MYPLLAPLLPTQGNGEPVRSAKHLECLSIQLLVLLQHMQELEATVALALVVDEEDVFVYHQADLGGEVGEPEDFGGGKDSAIAADSFCFLEREIGCGECIGGGNET